MVTDILFVNGEEFTNVCDMEVKVILNNDAYVRKTLTSRVKISPATYDISGFTLKDKTVIYNGEKFDLVGEGELPEGVNVSYYIGETAGGIVKNISEGHSAVEIGRYFVEARFTGANPNYEIIKSMHAYLEITKKPVEIAPLEKELTDQAREIITFDGQNKFLDFRPAFSMPDKIDANAIRKTYYKIGEDGKATETDTVRDVGKYAVRMTNIAVRPDYAKTYEADRNYVYAEYEITRGMLDLKEYFPDKGFIYDGTEIAYGFNESLLPESTVARVEKYEITKFGETVEKIKDYGTYELKVSFTYDPNYEIKPLCAEYAVAPYIFNPSGIDDITLEFSEEGYKAEDLHAQLFSNYPKFVYEESTAKFYEKTGEEYQAITEIRLGGDHAVKAEMSSPTYNVSFPEEYRSIEFIVS
ncbi:MAG: hypothetical protein MJ072_04745, partial [Clostridia bacterium]|nr:hypothetical protein [Clostridia bacterium]